LGHFQIWKTVNLFGTKRHIKRKSRESENKATEIIYGLVGGKGNLHAPGLAKYCSTRKLGGGKITVRNTRMRKVGGAVW